MRNIYSSRRIEEFCRNDIRFMWLTGNVTPHHNTISCFHSSRRLEGCAEDSFRHHWKVPRGGRVCKSGCSFH
ncbi:transposase [Bacteroides ovatus]|nr:transposase [Bacteroides ovatus]